MAYEGGAEHQQAPGPDNTMDHRRWAQAESEAICGALRERLLHGTVPPDDAYWWTRIALWDLTPEGPLSD